MSYIEFINIGKSYNSNSVINGLNLKIDRGDFVTILGKSGCGKTTILKMVNKLISYDCGELYINSQNIKIIDTIKLRRSIGYVIQNIGLFPHMNIKENISYILTLLKRDKNYKDKRVEELVELVGLDTTFLNRYPSELSGGQCQRVGVARALAPDPDIILMDEPFGAVDEITRNQLQNELMTIHQNLNKTILFVTHDINEAIKLGSKVILLNNGSIEQIGTSEELIFSPKSPYVRNFLGYKGFKATLKESQIMDIYSRALKDYNRL